MKKILGAAIMAIFFFAAFVYANHDEGMHPANGFFLPDGNPEAGKKAFTRLKCTSCHWVQNEVDLSQPVTQKIGPMLGGKQAKYSAGWIANSLISPSHAIVWDSDGQAENSELSRMGDFTETMTVREMIDIVAYIRSLGKPSDKRLN